MPKPLFDRKFGDEFIKTVPLSAGVYEMLDDTGTTIYVGKAKLLRRRLQQYRNANRCKKHQKMREILRSATNVRIRPCESELAALLLENELIQRLRPRFNISGAFSFLYPCIGLRREKLNLTLCCTTSPQEFGETFIFYGAFRSREITREGFRALADLFEFIGHREPAKNLTCYPSVKFSSLRSYRQVTDQWVERLDGFLKGTSNDILETAVFALLEKPYARRHAGEIQQMIDALVRFYRFEALPLRRVMHKVGLAGRGVSQLERDRLFLQASRLQTRRRQEPETRSS